MIKADLHIHSNISDGSDTIDEIIELAISSGLTHISITDHDTLEGSSYAIERGREAGISVISGIEISAIDKRSGIKAHILGYGINNTRYLEDICSTMLEDRHNNCLEQISILNRNGFNIDINELSERTHRYIYKQHIMDYLYKRGQIEEMFGDFYYSVFKNGGMCDFDISYIDVFDAVKAVKASGGYAVLAHPGQQKNYTLIHELIEAGLSGIELNHISNSDIDRGIIAEIAKEHGLFLTGGSDYHGLFESRKTTIGEYLSERKAVEVILRAVKRA